jgi:cell division cycle protein 20 (cofactor of APC complex)
MQEGSDLAKHVNVFNQLVADLGKVDVKNDDEDMAIVLLCSLPDSYDHLVTTLTYGKEKVQVDMLLRLCFLMSRGGRTTHLKSLLGVLL